jgi:hypothetical protein
MRRKLKKIKKTFGYKILLGFLVFLGIAILAALLMLTPVGNSIIKTVIESKMEKYVPGAEITYLDYGINNFSLAAKKGHNVVKVYGALFPLSAMFEGNIENLSELTPDYRGKMNLSGKLYTRNRNLVIDGMSFFANGYMNFKTELNNGVSLEAKGSDFDLKRLLYMAKIDYPWVEGKTDVTVNKRFNAPYKIKFQTTGEYRNKLDTTFKAVTTVNMKNRRDLKFTSDIDAGIGNILLNGYVTPQKWGYKFHVRELNLSKMKPVLLYPFKSTTDIEGVFDSSNGVLKFRGENFEGFEDSKIELTFKLNARKFFEYTGIDGLFKGDVSGTLKIKDSSGTFDIVSNNTQFLSTSFIKRLYRVTGIDLAHENIGKVFFKGYFNKRETVFDMLSTNQNISLSVKGGEFIYPDKFDIVLYLRKNNDVFKILITNSAIKVLEKRDFRDKNNEILVF